MLAPGKRRLNGKPQSTVHSNTTFSCVSPREKLREENNKTCQHGPAYNVSLPLYPGTTRHRADDFPCCSRHPSRHWQFQQSYRDQRKHTKIKANCAGATQPNLLLKKKSNLPRKPRTCATRLPQRTCSRPKSGTQFAYRRYQIKVHGTSNAPPAIRRPPLNHWCTNWSRLTHHK